MFEILPEVSARQLIINEISSVCSALRRNSRWANANATPVLSSPSSLPSSQFLGRKRLSRSPSSPTVNQLAIGPSLFTKLQVCLRDSPNLNHIDAHVLLSPFLEIIRSGETSGPITAAALSAVDKFIIYGLVHVDSPSLPTAMQDLSAAGTHCKFEASDAVSDEVVLVKILQVLKNTLTSGIGRVLSDEAVCEMMETGLSMCCQMRLSEMLRKTAERTMQSLVAAVFRQLQSIPTSQEEQTPAAPLPLVDDGGEATINITRPDPSSELIPAASTSSQVDLPVPQTEYNPSISKIQNKQYGLPCIRELLRVVVSLLDPHDNQHTDSMRLLALGILSTAFEVGGRSIGRFPSLRTLVADKLCKHLFQLATSENSAVMGPALRVIAIVFDTSRNDLRLQQELYLSFVLDRLVNASAKETELDLDKQTWDAPRNSLDASSIAVNQNMLAVSTNGIDRSNTASPAPGMTRSQPASAHHLSNEARTLLLEQLCTYARQSDTGPMLWINYDCHIESDNLWERLVRFFSRGVYSSPLSSGSQQHHHLKDQGNEAFQLLCLDAILTCIEQIYNRLPEAGSNLPAPPHDALRQAKARKALLLEGAAQFNAKPKTGLKFLEANQLIYSEKDMARAESLARFLKTCPRINKRELGDFISRPDQIEVLKAYLQLFEFTDRIISDAMRDLLESFRLPGEAQQIDRITEVFAQVYFAAQKDKSIVRSQDAVYVLSFSIIMLNTDQHNPQNIKNRMKLEDYKRNLRGVNDKEDFPPEYLEAIYDDIRKREIVLPEEHYGQLGFEYAWRELMKRSRAVGSLELPSGPTCDAELFSVAWRPLITSLSHAFAYFEDEHVLQRCVTAFKQSAVLASRYGPPDVYDYMITSLARNTGLWPLGLNGSSGLFPKISVPAKEGEKSSDIVVSPLSIRLGVNTKAQLAAIVLFSVAISNAPELRSGWVQICQILQNLFLHSLLPADLLSLEDFTSGISTIPLKPKENIQRKDDRRSDAGLLSTLSSYLLSPYGPGGQDGLGRDLNEDDIDNTLCAVDCLAACRLSELYKTMLTLPPATLTEIISALIDLLSQRTHEKHSSNLAPGVTKSPLPYDASAMFLLEFVVSIVSSTNHAIASTAPIVLPFFDRLLLLAEAYSPLLVERAIVGLLRIIRAMSNTPQCAEALRSVLVSLQALPPAIIGTTAEQLSSNIIRLISSHPHLLVTVQDWSRALSFLSRTVDNEQAAKASFTFLQNVVYENRAGGLSAENFASIINVLSAFAIAAGQKEILNDSSLGQDTVIERGRRALDTIRDAQNAIGLLASGLSQSFAITWDTFWSPVLSAYAQHCVNAKRDIRQTALSHLQRTLVAQEMLSNPELDLSVVFERIIFPVLDELLKPQVFRRDPEGMGETRLRACALLCKIFLHCATQRQGFTGLLAIWMRVLDSLDRMMHSGKRDALYEAIPEQLKNAILVLSAQHILVPPAEQQIPEQAEIWTKTFTRINTFLPDLQQDIFGASISIAPAPTDTDHEISTGSPKEETQNAVQSET